MTIVQFTEAVSSYGADVLVLGLLDALLTLLFRKFAAKRLKKKYLTAVPFLLGILLYALFLGLSGRAFSAENLPLLLERGFRVGVAAVFCQIFFERFPRRTDAALSPSEAVVKGLLKYCLDEPRLSEAAKEIAGAYGRETVGEKEKATKRDKLSDLLKTYAPELTEAEIFALVRLVCGALDSLKR